MGTRFRNQRQGRKLRRRLRKRHSPSAFRRLLERSGEDLQAILESPEKILALRQVVVENHLSSDERESLIEALLRLNVQEIEVTTEHSFHIAFLANRLAKRALSPWKQQLYAQKNRLLRILLKNCAAEVTVEPDGERPGWVIVRPKLQVGTEDNRLHLHTKHVPRLILEQSLLA